MAGSLQRRPCNDVEMLVCKATTADCLSSSELYLTCIVPLVFCLTVPLHGCSVRLQNDLHYISSVIN